MGLEELGSDIPAITGKAQLLSGVGLVTVYSFIVASALADADVPATTCTVNA